MSSYQYRRSHCGDKTILWLSYLHNGISYTGRRHLYIESGPWCLLNCMRWDMSLRWPLLTLLSWHLILYLFYVCPSIHPSICSSSHQCDKNFLLIFLWFINVCIYNYLSFSDSFSNNALPAKYCVLPYSISTLRLRQNGHHFTDNIFKVIFFNENCCIFIEISLKKLFHSVLSVIQLT